MDEYSVHEVHSLLEISDFVFAAV